MTAVPKIRSVRHALAALMAATLGVLLLLAAAPAFAAAPTFSITGTRTYDAKADTSTFTVKSSAGGVISTTYQFQKNPS